MTFLGLQPSRAAAAIDAASGEPLSYRELIARAGVISGHLGQDKQLVFLLSRNDMFSSTALRGHPAGRTCRVHARRQQTPGWSR